MVAEYAGKKNLKALDLTKAMIAKHGEGTCDKEDCKKAIRLLIDSGRCVYSYLGGSYIQLPPKAGRCTLILVPVASGQRECT